ncbi:Glycogen synthase, ADP-glucose transglucosylase (EC [Kosakonia radicincitans]|nr:Glycogen synthase, ADP-glucose transglucosylase (EC [Kosakonia radicincitans]
MQVLHVCSEMFPLLKTGGLADVIGALPAAQIAGGVDTRVLLPAFPDIRRGVSDAQVSPAGRPLPGPSRCCLGISME